MAVALRPVLIRALLALQAVFPGLAADWGSGSAWIRATDLLDSGDRVVLCRPFPADGVTLVYTHSMYGGDVRERFVPDGRSLRRVEMTTANPAAAEYYATTVSVTEVDGRYRVDAPPATYDQIVVRVDDVGRHRLVIGDEMFDLLALTGQAHRVRLDVMRDTWWQRFVLSPGRASSC
jgi:hypothetical protein